MSPSSFEMSMQIVGSVVSEYPGKNNSAEKGLEQLMKEQFPNFEKKEIAPGVYEIRIRLNVRQVEMSLPLLESAAQTSTDVVNECKAEGTNPPVNEQLPSLIQADNNGRRDELLEEFLIRLQVRNPSGFQEFLMLIGRGNT